jgi:hypothetical protein
MIDESGVRGTAGEPIQEFNRAAVVIQVLPPEVSIPWSNSTPIKY